MNKHDSLRLTAARAIAPIVTFILFWRFWYSIGLNCDIGPGCLGWGPLTFVLIFVFLFWFILFSSKIDNRAASVYGDSGISLLKLLKRPVLISTVIVVLLLVLFLNSKTPETIEEWFSSLVLVFFPLLSVLCLYSIWYLIAGRYNKALRTTECSGQFHTVTDTDAAH